MNPGIILIRFRCFLNSHLRLNTKKDIDRKLRIFFSRGIWQIFGFSAQFLSFCARTGLKMKRVESFGAGIRVRVGHDQGRQPAP